MSIIADAAGIAKSVFQTIEGIIKFKQISEGTSLVEVSKPARVEPITVISKDLISTEYLPDVLQTLLSVFTGYYLQAVPSGCSVGSVEVNRVLNNLNPDGGMWDSIKLVSESYDDRVYANANKYKFSIATEAEDKAPVNNDKDLTAAVMDASNLAVGKLINVKINYDTVNEKGECVKGTANIPVTIRLATVSLTNNNITNLLASQATDVGFVERYHAWRSGRISFIRDLVFCTDLADEHRKNIIKDETGVYDEIIRRVRNKKAAAAANIYSKSGSIPMNVASNLFIISKEVAKELEFKIGGKLSDPHVRNRVFKGIYAMIIVVVDKDWERVTMYHRGLATATELSIRDLKGNSKAKGPDIMDILKSYQIGSVSSF